MKNCKKPKCVYSVNKKSCIKPNPYIQFISYCTKSNKSLTECKKEYNKKTDYIKNNACDYYSQNNKTEKKPQKLNLQSCPKPRRPLNGKCPEISPVLKLNKHNVECCYKDLTKKKVQEKIVKPKANAKTKGKKKEDFETILRRELKSNTPSTKGTSETYRSAVSSSSTPAKKGTSESFHSPLSSNKSSRKGTSESFRSAVSSNKSSRKGTSESFRSAVSSSTPAKKRTSESFHSPLSSNKSSKKGTSESFHSAVSSHSNDELNRILRRQRDRIKREEQKKSSSSNDSFHSARQSPVNPFENILRKQQQKDYLDTKKKKYFKVVNKYGNKKPVKEITKFKQS